MSQKKPAANSQQGEFPYSLVEGSAESRYLTWIRNHSNYMAERGFLDYLRLVAVLVRGILLNFLMLLPPLLVVSLLLGFFYKPLLTEMASASGVADNQAYAITPYAIALFALWVLLFPIVSRLSKVVGYRKALDSGSSSSVKLRNVFERSFGALLLIIITIALIESMPLLVHHFHAVRGLHSGWALPTVSAAVGVLVAANKLLPLLGGYAAKLAVIVVGALGLLVPLIVVMFVVEFLVYHDPYKGALVGVVYILPVLIALMVVATLFLGIRNLRFKGYKTIFSLLGAMIVLFVVVILGALFGSVDYKNFYLVLALTVEVWVFCALAIDVNLTSINGLYRDRLASAFLVGEDTKGDIDIERDVDLQEICQHETFSTAPYHLVNVALNLQGSSDISVRERNSDFFIFSKRFIGSDRTGYCRSENMEQVYPQIDLGTAMAISAAAAAPNMGRGTNPLMVMFLTLLNVRLGFWMPNPDRLEKHLLDKKYDEDAPKQLNFADHVFPNELAEVRRRREQAYASLQDRPVNEDAREEPTLAHNLVGIGFSGGGIRSATINLGIAQALERRGVFNHLDYMSTVSGGGYLGSSISTLMRYKTKPFSEIDGTVSLEKAENDETLVNIKGSDGVSSRRYRYTSYVQLDPKIKQGAEVIAGQRLTRRTGSSDSEQISLYDRYQWRVRPAALLREMISRLDETHKWVNLSDGGHIENLATIELLRRRCKFIIIGDGEADPKLHFNGLATLIRYARIDLGTHIDINPGKLRLNEARSDLGKCSEEHFAFGKIWYPGETDCGYLLYLKSSFTGDEDEVITEYRHRNPSFPHESTADQFFDEGQFEAYRALGQHIAEQALTRVPGSADQVSSAHQVISYSDLEGWFKAGLASGASSEA